MLLTDGVQSIGAHPVPASSCAPCRTSLPPPALTPAVFRAANLPSRTLAPPLPPFSSLRARASVTHRSWHGEKEALGPKRALVCWPQDCGAKFPSAPRHRNAAPRKLLHPWGVCCFSFRSSFLFRSSFPFRSSSSFRSSFPCAACLRALLSCWRVSRPVCATSEPRAYPTPIAA